MVQRGVLGVDRERRTPLASASAPTSSPPPQRLLVGERDVDPLAERDDGRPRPAEPTIALTTRSASESATSRTRPSAPASTSPSVHTSAARAAASGPTARSSGTRGRGKRHQLGVRGARREPDQLEALTGAGDDVDAWAPIEPVAPRMSSRVISRPLWQRAPMAPLSLGPPIIRGCVGVVGRVRGDRPRVHVVNHLGRGRSALANGHGAGSEAAVRPKAETGGDGCDGLTARAHSALGRSPAAVTATPSTAAATGTISAAR